jgi:hypothetical protein
MKMSGTVVDILVGGIPLKKYFSDKGDVFVTAHAGEKYSIRVNLEPGAERCYIELTIDGKLFSYCFVCDSSKTMSTLRLDAENVSVLEFRQSVMTNSETGEDFEPIDPQKLGTIKVFNQKSSY